MYLTGKHIKLLFNTDSDEEAKNLYIDYMNGAFQIIYKYVSDQLLLSGLPLEQIEALQKETDKIEEPQKVLEITMKAIPEKDRPALSKKIETAIDLYNDKVIDSKINDLPDDKLQAFLAEVQTEISEYQDTLEDFKAQQQQPEPAPAPEAAPAPPTATPTQPTPAPQTPPVNLSSSE